MSSTNPKNNEATKNGGKNDIITKKQYLPHENKDLLFLTDSGMETTFVFKDHIELREFAAFELTRTEKGRNHLKEYYRRHVQLAMGPDDGIPVSSSSSSPAAALSDDTTKMTIGFVLESHLWRANPDWMKKLGYEKPEESIPEFCQQAMDLLQEIQDEFPHVPTVKSGTVGPRADGYVAKNIMSPEEAKEYHLPQVAALQKAGADIVSGMTLNYINEGMGIAMAAAQVGIPVVLSFTVETDGCLISGESIQTIIETIDAATGNYPAYYMINCAHPTHFYRNLAATTGPLDDVSKSNDNGNMDMYNANASTKNAWKLRIGGIRANASKLSHAELDESETLDDGNPVEFGQEHMSLLMLLPNVNVVGGCCGTDHRHVREIRAACTRPFQMRPKRE